MQVFTTKHILIIIGTLALLGVGMVAIVGLYSEAPAPAKVPVPQIKATEPKVIVNLLTRNVIGKSVEGRDIDAYIYGKGPTHLMFVGGIHGGYEWNSILLAYQFIDYLQKNPNIIPKNLTISVIPNVNPDGLYRVVKKEGRFMAQDVPSNTKLVESGRFNAHNVDLNRNFDCKWKPKSMWRNKIVSAGTGAFSEPEAAAIRDFVLKNTPSGVVFWHSQANAVYASECKSGILPKTLDIMNTYARASGYEAVKSFTAYETSGDSEGWLASINIPAITVELKNHEDIEWERNLAGTMAILKYYTVAK